MVPVFFLLPGIPAGNGKTALSGSFTTHDFFDKSRNKLLTAIISRLYKMARERPIVILSGKNVPQLDRT